MTELPRCGLTLAGDAGLLPLGASVARALRQE